MLKVILRTLEDPNPSIHTENNHNELSILDQIQQSMTWYLVIPKGAHYGTVPDFSPPNKSFLKFYYPESSYNCAFNFGKLV